MLTTHKYGSRTAEERLRNPEAKPSNFMWLCDNPCCKKAYHYTPTCLNDFRLKPTQSRKAALIEQAVNAVTSFILAFLLNLYALPMLGIHSTPSKATYITLIFTGASAVRGYIIRRIFNRL